MTNMRYEKIKDTALTTRQHAVQVTEENWKSKVFFPIS